MTEVAVIDSRYVSRYAEQTLGIQVYKAGVLADADGNDVDVVVRRLDTGTPVTVATGNATRVSTGVYAYTVSGAVTQVVGHYEAVFSYTVDGTADTYALNFAVGEVSPDYDALSPGYKGVVEAVMVRLADLWDNPYGGPHLQSYVQTHFGRNRVAQLLRTALGTLNAYSSPFAFFGFAPAEEFPLDSWGILLEKTLWIEVVKHLRRSYLEQPEVSLGASVARFDRSVYFERWGQILTDEREDMALMLDNFKMAHMGLGTVHVLVSGGAYGNWGPYVDGGGAGEAAARGYWFVRRSF